MKLAVIGSRGIVVAELEKYIPQNAEEIVSGGARGVDTCAAEYARTPRKAAYRIPAGLCKVRARSAVQAQ